VDIDKEHILQSSQDSPPPSKRPSLLATGDEDTNSSQPLLAGIDGAAANRQPKPPKAAPAKRTGVWLAALLVLVAGGGAAAWMSSSDNGTERVAVAPAVAVPPRAPASAPPVEAPDVSTAAILHDTPAADDRPALVLQSAAPVKNDASSLAAALESKSPAPAAPVAKADKSSDAAKAARARERRLAVREREEKRHAEKHPLARNVIAKAAAKKNKAPEADNDSDVALLAALVAHSKNSQAAKPAADPNAADARKLRQCKALDSAAQADACRARVCGGGAKGGASGSAACKPARATQVVDAS
jgi:hypothetical protein